MKIFTSQIIDKYNINQSIDFSKEIEGRNDIVSIDDCHVNGYLEYVHEEVKAYFNVQVTLELASARSLKPVEHHLDFNLDLLFGSSKKADYALTEEISLREIIFGHILVFKPYSIYAEDEPEQIEKPKQVNPAFSKLKDW